MRTAGMILGGLFLVDGLMALCCGKSAARWVNNTFGKSVPGGVREVMKQTEKVDDRVLTSWGINNTIAGTAILLTSMLMPCTCDHKEETLQEEVPEEAAKCC